MSILLIGDCLEELKDIQDKSVDLIFCDLPYGQTSCKWDCLIDLEELWKEFMRVKKLNTPIIMTCTTKFGVSLINSAPKKCPFRYDLIWCKSSSSGFLSAKKMPLRKHEMIYVFYEKLPFYDLSSHKHKFLEKEITKNCETTYGNVTIKPPKTARSRYDPPLPDSLIKENTNHIKDGQIYNGGKAMNLISDGKGAQYDPPLPNSLIKEDDKNIIDGPTYNTKQRKKPIKRSPPNQYDPPLPNSLIKEKTQISKAKEKDLYGKCAGGTIGNVHGTNYEPPLPDSLLEIKSTRGKHSTEKPVALMEWLLKYYSKEGDVILDPTMGSGSMGVACVSMKRNFIGIEKDEEIYEVAVNRINPE